MSSILCINQGSSSLKYALYHMGAEETLITSGEIDRIGFLLSHPKLTCSAVAHRIVHGGHEHTQPEKLTPFLLEKLRKIQPYAPLHLPQELALVEEVQKKRPDLPQFLCFDTAYHRKMPLLSQYFPLDKELFSQGILRYGFHGLSYEYIVSTLPFAEKRRLIIAHLGSGASLAAVRDGKPWDTTMGFSPAGGIMMGSRSGDLDPGICTFLLQTGWDEKKLTNLVNHQSGLLGISGKTADLQTLLQEQSSEAAFAVELFSRSVQKAIGSLAASMGGLETLVFTGGIGENGASFRETVCSHLGFLGITIDPEKNQKQERIISSEGSCTVFVIPTREDLMMARHTYQLLKTPAH